MGICFVWNQIINTHFNHLNASRFSSQDERVFRILLKCRRVPIEIWLSLSVLKLILHLVFYHCNSASYFKFCAQCSVHHSLFKMLNRRMLIWKNILRYSFIIIFDFEYCCLNAFSKVIAQHEIFFFHFPLHMSNFDS